MTAINHHPSLGRLERRVFLQVGALGGIAAAAGGCSAGLVGPLELPGSTVPEAMDSFFGRVDATVRAIGEGSPLHEAFPHVDAARVSRARLLLQKALRSLVVLGAYRQLAPEARDHPGMRARLEALAPEMDDAVFGVHEMLTSLRPAQRVELQQLLKRDPTLPERLVEGIDREAAVLGEPFTRRMQLRPLAKSFLWRLQHQPLGSLLDEYVGKVEKLGARMGYDEALRRQIAARATSSALLAWHTSADAAPVAPPAAGSALPNFDAIPEAPEAAPCAPPPGRRPMIVGGILMGVGAGLAIPGAILAAAGSAAIGIPFLVVAGLLFLGGLIALIVGATMGPAPVGQIGCP